LEKSTSSLRAVKQADDLSGTPEEKSSSSNCQATQTVGSANNSFGGTTGNRAADWILEKAAGSWQDCRRRLGFLHRAALVEGRRSTACTPAAESVDRRLFPKENPLAG
jgi:hypothetical protein